MNLQSTSPVPFLLASLVSSYPDNHFAEYVNTLLYDEELTLPDNIRKCLAEVIKGDESLNDLRSEYIDLFDRSKELNPLYETEYGRERAMFKANELSDISGFYKAFGFNMDGEDLTKEMPDHLSVEFEFYSLLVMKYTHLEAIADREGCDIVLDAQRKFLKDHLGRFVASISDRPGVKASKIYSEILGWCADVVNAEAKRIDVPLEKATWFASQAETEEVCCGGSVAKVPQ